MDKVTNNILAAVFLEKKVNKILEASEAPWAAVDKSKLPMSCFLWVEDPNKKSTWHLPYREGIGGIDSETGMYKQAGDVNLNALRAIAQAIGGARTGEPMNLPPEIKSKVSRILKRYKIGDISRREGKRMKVNYNEITESVFTNNKLKHDKESCIVYGVAVLNESSRNCSYKKGKGRKYSPEAMESAARLIEGRKSYVNHATREELEERGGIRNVRDLLGFFENGRVDGKTTRADFHYLENHKEWFAPIVDQMSDKVGFSIHAYGPSTFNESTLFETVQDLKIMQSTDLVTEPGSTSNIFESLRRSKEEDMDISNLKLADLIESRPDLVGQIVKEHEESAETKKSIEGKEKEIQTLKEENKKLKETLDKYEVKAALAKKKSMIMKKIEESKLPKEAVTEVFKSTLLNTKEDAEIDVLIKDRKSFIKESAIVKGMGDEADPDKDHDYTESSKTYGKAIEGYKVKNG
jgi:hypothetical protein